MIWLCSTARGEPRVRRLNPGTGVEQVVPRLPAGTTQAALLDAVSVLAEPGDLIAITRNQLLWVMRPATA